MKDYDLSANFVSATQSPGTGNASAEHLEQADARTGAEYNADELATALAMMHATLESTTDAILVTDQANSSFGEFPLT